MIITAPVLSIWQPYAYWIVVDTKRAENRDYPTPYRGPVWLHACKTRKGMSLGDAGIMDQYHPAASFGAIVGVAELFDCINIAEFDRKLRMGEPIDSAIREAMSIDWATGPYCWLLRDVRGIKPIPYKGSQGFKYRQPITHDMEVV